MVEFDAIRPYSDDEVPSVLHRLTRDEELLGDACLALANLACHKPGGGIRRGSGIACRTTIALLVHNEHRHLIRERLFYLELQ